MPRLRTWLCLVALSLCACQGEVSGWAFDPAGEDDPEGDGGPGEDGGSCDGLLCPAGERCVEGVCVGGDGSGREVSGPLGDGGAGDSGPGGEDAAPAPRCDPVDDAVIPRAPLAPEIDGDLSDWPCPFRFRLTFATAALVDPEEWRPGGEDCSVELDLAWDASFLYLAARVRDDSLWSDSTQLWEDDSVELYVNGDGSADETIGPDDHQITVVRDGRVGDWGSPVSASALGLEAAARDGAPGYSIELAVPWSMLGAGPAEGRALTVDVAVNDDDDGGPEDAHGLMWLLPPGLDPVHSPNVYRPFVLGP